MSKFKLPQLEEDVLKKWQEEETFKKSLEKESPKGDFVFYDGPPFATGLPHHGHLVASLIKDVVPRYKTMQGYYVERRWGWDTHGLPIENIVEKELGLEAKKDIIDYGIDKFNNACHSKVMLYREEWRKTIERFGRWADMDNDYKTMDLDFMESIWWVFKELWDKGLIYEDYKSMHICPRCETTLSQSEVTEGYKTVKDMSVTAEFRLVKGQKAGDFEIPESTSILSWTTTPWTLPGNVALAVGSEIEYVVIEKPDEESGPLVRFVLAKALLQTIFGDEGYEVIAEVKGSALVGLQYESLFDYFAKKEKLENKDNGWKIYAADFVTTEEGTGIVHIAPAFGQDDMNLGKEYNLPFVQHVGMDGHFTDEVTDFAGMHVKPKDDHMATDIEIVKHLAHAGKLFHKEKYEHSYSHCWRCDTPLLNYATSSWFVNVLKIKERALELAKDISWVPAHMKEGRWGNWLEGARDWSISRQRFWGSVIPLWQCENADCDEHQVFGSIDELEKVSGIRVDNLHKHIVDEVTFPCDKCQGTMRRIPDVLDCWFESGSMPYAQQHYPFEHKEKFEKNFPAQFIAEGADQTRAWFYYLHILATGVKDCPAFQNVVVNGIVLAEDGKKMSKRLKNYPEPDYLFDTYGADAVRYYLVTSPAMHADDLRFVEKGVEEKARMFVTLLNVVSFFNMFAEHIAYEPATEEDLQHVLDMWITARLNELLIEVTKKMEVYDLQGAARPIETFIDDLSTWYVRRSRDRFKSDDDSVKMPAVRVLRRTLFHLSRIMAPFTPFIADHVYCSELKGDMSVHLKEWSEVNFEDVISNSHVIQKMEYTRQVVEKGLAKRDEVGIGVRQPLQTLEIINNSLELDEAYFDIIKDELNIKEIKVTKGSGELSVVLDTEITEELRLEGMKRDLVRQINALRKKQGLSIEDTVTLHISSVSKDIQTVISKFSDDILQSTVASGFADTASGEAHSVSVGGAEVSITLNV